MEKIPHTRNMNVTASAFNEPVSFMWSGDPIVLEYYFVKYAILPVGMIILYLLTIYFLGPWYMKNRKPFTNLKKYILFYNFYTVAANAWCCYKVIVMLSEYGTVVLCTDAREDCKVHQVVRREAIDIVMQIYGLKFIEMLDTMFFILLKKFDHVSKLHAFHHSSVPFIIWYSLRTQRRMHLVIYGTVNSVIHVIMYTYYGLSLMGPNFQIIRRWKKYITLVQIFQFICMLPYFVYIISIGCATSKSSVVVFIIHTTLLLYLFSDYYVKSYIHIPQKRQVAFNGPALNGIEKTNGVINVNRKNC